MKVVFTGLESSGKSLRLAMEAQRVLIRNGKWLRKTGIVRPIVSNMLFTPQFLEQARYWHIPIIIWSEIDELITLEDCDVFIDEIGNYFDARFWENLSLDVRSWIRQSDKNGVEMYCGAQDFGQIDKSFRTLVKELYLVIKIVGSPRPSATRPPVKRIWGLCIEWQLNPRSFKGDMAEMKIDFWIPTVFMIQRHYCELFDTRQKIKPNIRVAKRHMVYYCRTCGWEHTVHF